MFDQDCRRRLRKVLAALQHVFLGKPLPPGMISEERYQMLCGDWPTEEMYRQAAEHDKLISEIKEWWLQVREKELSKLDKRESEESPE